MPIRIVERPEPLSENSYLIDPDKSPLLIESDAARLLTSELRAYCGGEISGRSFLIAGHRGAGKTTLVANAFLDIWKESERGTGIRRPLLVSLNGPSLFVKQVPAPAAPADESDTEGATKPEPPDPAENDKDEEDEDEGDAAKPKTRSEKTEAQVALEQIILGLHRAVTREFSRRFRRRVAGFNGRVPVALAQAGMAELSAQFDAELMECPEPARLSAFYRQAGSHKDGVLGTTGDPEFQAAAELLALSGICDAYKRISGDYMREERMSDRVTREIELRQAKESTVKDLVTAAVPLFIGGATGVGVAASSAGSGLEAVGAGFLAALGSAAVVKFSVKRSTTRSRVENFIYDLSLATLDRVLPVLIERLWHAGLAPVFVVDELDKIDDLAERMRDIVHHLKKLVAENAFFCFLADREYFEGMLRQSSQRAYPVEYTYYSHRLFVVFHARDLAQYLEKRIPKPLAQTPPPGVPQLTPEQASAGAAQVLAAGSQSGDEPDREILLWVLRHRSQLHPLDLRRQITALRDPGGQINLPTGEVRDRPAYLIDVTMQVLIEALLNDADVRHKVADNYEYLRLVHDALYFITRRWIAGKEALDISDAGQKVFEDYLKQRTGIKIQAADAAAPHSGADASANANTVDDKSKKKTKAQKKEKSAAPEPNNDDAMSKYDSAFLFRLVARLAAALANEKVAGELIFAWEQTELKARRANPVPTTVRSAMLLNARECILVAKPGVDGALGSTTFEWRYDPSGRDRIGAARVSQPAEAPKPAPAPAPAVAPPPVQVLAEAPPPAPKPAPAATPPASAKDREAAPKPTVPPPATPGPISPELLVVAKRTEKFHESLNRVVTGTGPPETPLRYDTLASQFRIIPTRPAWEVVDSAIKRLNRGVYTDATQMNSDLGLVQDFWGMLEQNAENIVRAVVCAAAVGMASGATLRSECVLLGLEVLSRALRLASQSEANVQRLLRATTAQLIKIFDGTLSAYGTMNKSAQQWAALDDYLLGFIGAVDSSVKLDEDRWQGLRTLAWESAQKRVMAFLTDAPAHDPDVSEMFCANSMDGPALVVPFDFSLLPAADLTAVLVRAVQTPQTSPDIDPQEVPAWAGMAAMHALGFGTFNPQHLTDAGNVLTQRYEQPLKQELPRLFREGLLARRRPPDTTVIVIRRPSGSLVGSWPVQAHEFLFLAPTVAQAETLVASGLPLQYFFGEGPHVIAVEMQPETATMPVDIEMKDGVPALPAKLARRWKLQRPSVVYLYLQPPTGKTLAEPALISPKRLEEIVSAAQKKVPSTSFAPKK